MKHPPFLHHLVPMEWNCLTSYPVCFVTDGIGPTGSPCELLNLTLPQNSSGKMLHFKTCKPVVTCGLKRFCTATFLSLLLPSFSGFIFNYLCPCQVRNPLKMGLFLSFFSLCCFLYLQWLEYLGHSWEQNCINDQLEHTLNERLCCKGLQFL